MKFNQKLILGFIFGCSILDFSLVSTNMFKMTHPNYNNYSLVQSVVQLNFEAQSRLLQNTIVVSVEKTLGQKTNKQEILRKHFPDWEERMNYQKKQEKFYRSGKNRIAEGKRCKVKIELTKQEKDAFDYLNGQNFYKYYQSLETPPNIFDTRQSFLLKIEKNENMRENFLKSYNKKFNP